MQSAAGEFIEERLKRIIGNRCGRSAERTYLIGGNFLEADQIGMCCRNLVGYGCGTLRYVARLDFRVGCCHGCYEVRERGGGKDRSEI